VVCGPGHIHNVITARIFRFRYSAVGNCAVIVDITTIHCALYCKFGAKCSTHPPVYASWTVVQVIYNVITARHIQASIFDGTYLCRYWRYLVNSMWAIMQTWCQLQRTSSSLRHVNCGPGHIQSIYSSAYSDFIIQLNVSALLLEIWRQFNARYTAYLVPITAHTIQLSLCEQWSRPYTRYLHFRKFRIHYSTEGSSPAIGGISTIQWALYFKLGVKYSPHPPVYAMWTVVPAIYKVFTAPHV
jgi:hypothetical protein